MRNHKNRNLSRRAFLKYGGLSAAVISMDLTFPVFRHLQSNWITHAEPLYEKTIPGKNGLSILNNRPLNAETPSHLLDDTITPNDRHFIRNNGLVPQIDATKWTLTVDGEVHTPLVLTLEQLKRFKQYT